MSRCDPDPRYATYTGEVRAQAVRDLLHEAQQYEREGLPLSAAVYRECAAELAAAEGLRRIGVAVAVWAGMAAARAEARRDVVARHALALALDISVWHALAIGDDLAAERAARRKWELRLRARADRRKHSRKFYYGYDRLQWRASRADSGQGPKD